MWCIKEIDETYRLRMYDLLDLYERPYDPLNPVVGLDEKPKQLLEDSRTSLPMKPGRLEKTDYEYVRRGKANIFVVVEPKGGKRFVKVTDRRCKKDFAQIIEELADQDYPDAQKISVVLDNLNTHKKESLYETFGMEEAERILRRIEFHYTPKHASWLNVAEIEINVMDIECTGRRIPQKETLNEEVNAWAEKRNLEEKKIDWRFTKKDADKKLSKYYVT
jgi:hypothetical protein